MCVRCPSQQRRTPRVRRSSATQMRPVESIKLECAAKKHLLQLSKCSVCLHWNASVITFDQAGAMITLCLPVIQSNRIHALHICLCACMHACLACWLIFYVCCRLYFFLLSTWILQKPLILWSAGPRILAMWQTDRPTDTHRSTCTFHLLQWEKKNENVASIRVFFSSGLLLKPLENPPTTAAVRHASEPP